MSAPALWQWDGEALHPLPRFQAQCDRELVVGARYLMEPIDEVQSARDRAYFAAIREAWSNLPEGLAEQFPSPNDFRRHLLVACGFCTTKRLRFASAQAAMEALPVFAGLAALVEVQGAVVVVKTPMSQKLRGGMEKADRLRSYQETQDLAAAMIGVSAEDVERNVEQAA